jgi:hypothetical protein
MFCRDVWRTGITKTTKRQLILDCGLENKLSHAIPAQSSSLTSALSRQFVSYDGHYANNLAATGSPVWERLTSGLRMAPGLRVKHSSAIALGALLLLGREIPSFFILEMRLVFGDPSRNAAPSGRPISQPVFF